MSSGNEVSGVIKGQVSGFQQRFEATQRGSISVWDFRLERFDNAGGPLPRIPVEMRGTSFDGAISEGDWVEISGRWREGETLKTSRLKNLDTGALVNAKGASRGGNVVGCLVILIVLVVFAVIIFNIGHFSLP